MCGSETGSGGSSGSGGSGGGLSTGDGKYYISSGSMSKAKSVDKKEKASGGTPDTRYINLESHFNSGGLKMATSKGFTLSKDSNPQQMAKLREKGIKKVMGNDYKKVDKNLKL